MIVIVCGLPGSGKSYFAARLAKKINAVYVNSDRLRKEMFSARTYSEQEKAAVYNAMLQRMNEAIGDTKNLVVDATFHNSKVRQQFMTNAAGKASIFFIEVKANKKIIKQRVATKRLYSEADFEVYKLVRDQWEDLKEPHLLLPSTNGNINSMLEIAVQYLYKKNDDETSS